MCANKSQIKSIAIVDKIAEKLIDTFMPGPITLVLKKKVKNNFLLKIAWPKVNFIW